VTDEVIAASGWDRRAVEMAEVLERAVAMAPSPALPVNGEGVGAAARRRLPAGLPEAECRLRVTWEAPASCDMRPPCAYCNNQFGRKGKPGLSAPRGWWIRAFVTLAQRHGPLYLSACYGEPLSDRECIEVLAWVARENKVDISSNILAPVSALGPLPRSGNVAIATSYHPHAWGPPVNVGEGDARIAAFLAKRDEIERTGIRCGIASIVAWPPHLPLIEEFRARCEAVGVQAEVLPFWGTHEGREYPGAYSAEQWAVVGAGLVPHPSPLPGGEGTWAGLCRTGRDYLFVAWNGVARRCYMPEAQALGNVLRGAVRLLDEATACCSPVCPCPDMWRYREGC